MIVYVLFVHKKSVSKRKVCIIFIKNKKFKKTKKNIFSSFFRWVIMFFLGGLFWVFLGGFFIGNPASRTSCRTPPLRVRLARLWRPHTRSSGFPACSCAAMLDTMLDSWWPPAGAAGSSTSQSSPANKRRFF